MVGDRFHLFRFANAKLTEVRERATRECPGCGGRRTDPQGSLRRRLLIAHELLCPDSFARMWNERVDAADLGIEILRVYAFKEDLRPLLSLTPTADTAIPDRSEISHGLWRLYDQAAAY